MPAAVSLSQMVDLALGTPEVGAVNFNVLHTLLHAMLSKLEIKDHTGTLDEADRDFLSTNRAGPAVPEKGEISEKKSSDGSTAGGKIAPYHKLLDRMQKLELQLENLNDLPSNADLFGRAKKKDDLQDMSGTSSAPLQDMWQLLQVQKRVDANEIGINKLMSLVGDLMKEMQLLKDKNEELENKLSTAVRSQSDLATVVDDLSKKSDRRLSKEQEKIERQFDKTDLAGPQSSEPLVRKSSKMKKPEDKSVTKPLPKKESFQRKPVQEVKEKDSTICESSMPRPSCQDALDLGALNERMKQLDDQLNTMNELLIQYPLPEEVVTWEGLEKSLAGIREDIGRSQERIVVEFSTQTEKPEMRKKRPPKPKPASSSTSDQDPQTTKTRGKPKRGSSLRLTESAEMAGDEAEDGDDATEYQKRKRRQPPELSSESPTGQEEERQKKKKRSAEKVVSFGETVIPETVHEDKSGKGPPKLSKTGEPRAQEGADYEEDEEKPRRRKPRSRVEPDDEDYEENTGDRPRQRKPRRRVEPDDYEYEEDIEDRPRQRKPRRRVEPDDYKYEEDTEDRPRQRKPRRRVEPDDYEYEEDPEDRPRRRKPRRRVEPDDYEYEDDTEDRPSRRKPRQRKSDTPPDDYREETDERQEPREHRERQDENGDREYDDQSKRRELSGKADYQSDDESREVYTGVKSSSSKADDFYSDDDWDEIDQLRGVINNRRTLMMEDALDTEEIAPGRDNSEDALEEEAPQVITVEDDTVQPKSRGYKAGLSEVLKAPKKLKKPGSSEDDRQSRQEKSSHRKTNAAQPKLSDTGKEPRSARELRESLSSGMSRPVSARPLSSLSHSSSGPSNNLADVLEKLGSINDRHEAIEERVRRLEEELANKADKGDLEGIDNSLSSSKRRETGVPDSILKQLNELQADVSALKNSRTSSFPSSVIAEENIQHTTLPNVESNVTVKMGSKRALEEYRKSVVTRDDIRDLCKDELSVVWSNISEMKKTLSSLNERDFDQQRMSTLLMQDVQMQMRTQAKKTRKSLLEEINRKPTEFTPESMAELDYQLKKTQEHSLEMEKSVDAHSADIHMLAEKLTGLGTESAEQLIGLRQKLNFVESELHELFNRTEEGLTNLAEAQQKGAAIDKAMENSIDKLQESVRCIQKVSQTSVKLPSVIQPIANVTSLSDAQPEANVTPLSVAKPEANVTPLSVTQPEANVTSLSVTQPEANDDVHKTTSLVQFREVVEEHDAEALERMQKAIVKLRGEVMKLNDQTQHLLTENENKQKQIQSLCNITASLEEKKADKDYVDSEVDIKADKKEVNGKVNRTLFDSTCNELNKMISDLLEKLAAYEEAWRNANGKLSSDIDGKLDRLELDALKDYIDSKLRALNQKLKGVHDWMPAQSGDDDAAGLRKQLLQRFHCISCDRPVEMMPTATALQAMPSGTGFPSTRSPRPYTTFELDQIRQHAKSTNGTSVKPTKPVYYISSPRNQGRQTANFDRAVKEQEFARLRNRDLRAFYVHFGSTLGNTTVGKKRILLNPDGVDYYSTQRSCGGTHTTTFPHRRTTRLTNLREVFIDDTGFVAPKENERDIQGADGHIYKGRLDRNQNQLPNLPSQTSQTSQQQETPPQQPSPPPARPQTVVPRNNRSSRPQVSPARPVSARSGPRTGSGRLTNRPQSARTESPLQNAVNEGVEVTIDEVDQTERPVIEVHTPAPAPESEADDQMTPQNTEVQVEQ